MYMNRWNPFDEMLTFQRQADRLFNQFWTDLPSRSTGPSWSSSLQVHGGDETWRIDIPIPGIDPQHVAIETAGGTLTIRAEQPADADGNTTRFEQSFAMPQFLDVEKVSAAYRHGMLQLTLPLKDSVKPRRIPIEGVTGDKKQLVAV